MSGLKIWGTEISETVFDYPRRAEFDRALEETVARFRAFVNQGGVSHMRLRIQADIDGVLVDFDKTLVDGAS